MDPMLPPGLRVRPLREDDTAAVTALIAACELADDGMAEIDASDVAANFARHEFDPEQDAIVVLDGPHVVAWADVYRGRAEADVHPAYRGRGIGVALLRWTERRARALDAPRIRQTVSDGNQGAAALFRQERYEVAHVAWILEYRFAGGPPPAVATPAGVTMRPYAGPADDAAAYRLIEDAFNEWEGRDPTTFEEWQGYIVRHPAFAPALSRLAFDGDELVGAALAYDYRDVDEGWIHQVATRASHRGRGIARALLSATFGAFFEHGRAACALSTDSRTGALGLYEHVGMQVRRSYTSYARAPR